MSLDVRDGLGEVLGHLSERDGCPKRMVFGPCGGVRGDLRCEMADHACPFVAQPAPPWPAALAPAHQRAGSFLDAAAGRPVVVTDLTVTAFDPVSIRAVTALLAGSADVVLVGEHHNRPDIPPTMMAATIRDAGGQAIVTLTCRDRNRLVLEQELAGLALAEVAGVLCVTGDGRAHGVRPGVTQVFDVDGPRLAALANEAGLLACVPESPQAPPVNARPARLLMKQQAGAGLCILNHVSTPLVAGEFVSRARACGVTIPIIAGVAVFTDARSADVLARFPGLHLNPADVSRVLDAADPVAAGVDLAIEEARALLAIPGIAGINVSGLASDAGPVAAAAVKAAVGRGIQQL